MLRSYVSRYSMSTAYLSTSHYADQDSLSARLMQARFSGMFRFSCKSFVDYMSDPTTAAAGSDGPIDTGPIDDVEYTAKWDRNLLLMATALYAESFLAETGVHVPDGYGAHDFWHENCMVNACDSDSTLSSTHVHPHRRGAPILSSQEPNLERSAVPSVVWQKDKSVYGEHDAQFNEVPLVEFGPLLAYGSLRQLRDAVNGGAAHAEDFVTSSSHFSQDTTERRDWRSPFAIWRDVVCNPTFKYVIEDAVGDPPMFKGKPITDASSYQARRYDMSVPNALLGNSAIQRLVHRGCGHGMVETDCDPMLTPTYEHASLYQFVYVTSSHDPAVRPGWHRLVHIAVFPERSCEDNAKQICSSFANTLTANENYDSAATSVNHLVALGDLLVDRLGMNLDALGSFSTSSDSIASAAYLSSFSGYARQLVDSTEQPRVGVRIRDRRAGRRLKAMSFSVTLGVDATSAASGSDSFEIEMKKKLKGNSVGVRYIEMEINDEKKETNDDTTSWRIGIDALFAVRCSTELKATKLFASHPLLRSCEDAHAIRPYAGYAAERCNTGVLELEASDSVQRAEFYYDRMQLPYPPPSPPPPPPRPPPPSPPYSPPPPSPPVVIGIDEGKAIALAIQRDFCDSVRRRIPSPHVRCSSLESHDAQIPFFHSGIPAQCTSAVHRAGKQHETELPVRRQL